ncbi:retinoid-inducible serine carboxypeptidase-like [Condylostylus longicornis]|uniref:retinoid-inducible serine carboxypeptidase-like n=1 Tax=Condylostylus longicornis TaxID=2530218 RepID=UPI00244E3CA9|nr:retinoid-inducible serine carboxypeptidase-like [Condylostylus longicornis]
MIRLNVLLAVVALLFLTVDAKKGFGPGEQDWGHITVRPGAHMFYWLYYTTANVKNYTERPLAIWLQGGPGASSTGYGNFEELGPLDLELNYRNYTWVKDMNVLFIDNPVGSGFSYVENTNLLTRTNNEIALDLVALMKGFYKKHPEFKKVPLHIFCESYGGKMAPEFALELYEAIKRGEIESNLKSVALGDPWTSPMDSVWAWGPFLLQTAMVDQHGYEEIQAAAADCANSIKNERWVEATNKWGATQRVVMWESHYVDFYNILKKIQGGYNAMNLRNDDLMYRTLVDYDLIGDRKYSLDELMKGPVSETLGITKNVRWGSQSSVTFSALSGDFMKPVYHIVEKLLNSTDVQVGVFSGQLDLICATSGTVNWIDKMRWNYRNDYLNAPRKAISVNGIIEGYTKEAGNFSMHWINRAGHMAPADNPAGMSYVLQKYTNFGGM